jgi:hypothetical protein
MVSDWLKVALHVMQSSNGITDGKAARKQIGSIAVEVIVEMSGDEKNYEMLASRHLK